MTNTSPAQRAFSVVDGVSETQVRRLLDALPHMTWIIRHDLVFLFGNPRFTEFTGLDVDELRRIGWQPLVHPNDLPGMLVVLSQTMSIGEPFEVACRLRHHSGEYRHISGHGVPIRDANGTITEWMGTTLDVHDRWLSEEKLRRSEALLKSVLNSAVDGIISVDGRGVIDTFNEAAQAMFGYPADEACGQSLSVLIPALGRLEQQEQCSACDWTTAALLLALGPDASGRRRDGTLFPLEIAVSECDFVGERRCVFTVRDITERKQIEDARQASERRLQLALDAGKMGMWAWDFRDEYAHWSRTEFELLGLEPVADERVRSELFFQQVHPDDRPVLDAALRQAIESKGTFDLEFRIFRCDGEIRWLTGRGQVLLDPATGQPTQMIGVNYDVTQQRLAQAALEGSQRQLRLAMDASRLGVWEVNWADGTLIWDEAYGRQFGRRPDQYPSREEDFYECVHPDDREPVKAAFRRTVAEGVDFECEFRIVWPNGETRWHAAFGRTLSDGDGRPAKTIGVGRDITDRKRLEDQLRQSQKMQAVGQLAGGVAHDFNNILTVINGYAEMLDAQLPRGDERRTLLEQIRHAGEQAAALTRQLLAFSRKQVLRPQLVDLGAVVAEAHEILRRLIGEHIELVVQRESVSALVRVDPSQITQILLNLSVNARDAMPEGGRLSITTGHAEFDAAAVPTNTALKPGKYVVLTVSDTGCGMAAEVRDRVFEPFYTTKEPGKGTGLGLSVVHGIVSQSEGHVEVDSRPNCGTTFRIFLPQAAAEPEREPAAEEPTPARAAAATVLVVEDEEAVRGLTQIVLEADGFRVLTASSGPEAVRFVERNGSPLDLLITDVVMPGMSGPQLAQQLRGKHPDLRTLFLSGYTQDAVSAAELGDQRNAFLAKPFSRRALAEKVRSLVNRSRE